MKRKAIVGLSIALLSACSRPAATPGPTPAVATPSATFRATTPEPVHIETNSSGDRYITVVQRVTDGPSRQTRIAYELRAVSSQADIIGTQSIVTFEHPHITFHDREGKKLIADSPQAKITQRDKNVLMRGGVHARADDGSVLTCDTLRYDGASAKLHGYGHVVLSGPNNLTLTGNYLLGDIRLDDVRIAQHPL